MAKAKTVFVCAECGHEALKWLGKCPVCESWNSFVEELAASPAKKGAAHAVGVRLGGAAGGVSAKQLKDVDGDVTGRYATGLEELDRVLGGGLVRGSAVLLGGDPGIGKSTLLMQISQVLAQKTAVLYVSGEESSAQLKMRAQRLCLSGDGLYVLCETDLDLIEAQVKALNPGVIVVDSVQTVYRPEFSSAPGSISQVREATSALTRIAKQTGAAVFIVGHVTKQGAIAGPRVLEHLVDAVLYFEGDRQDAFRVLRTVKNRFGSTNEIGVFEMSDCGMKEVPNPSALFVSSRESAVPGCALLCTLEGTRPVLAEVQALCAYTAFGNPRRTSAGVDYNRMALLCAVLEKKLGIRLSDQDIYVNVVGGLRIDERSADLAVVAAIISSLQDKALRDHTVALGEVGLTGEVRSVTQAQIRAQECVKQGFKTLVLPGKNAANLHVQGIKIVGVDTVAQALAALLATQVANK